VAFGSGGFGSGGGTPIIPSGKEGGGDPLLLDIIKAPIQFQLNLLSDVADAVVGLGPGLYKLATDPIETTKQIGKAEWATWSPLFAGDFVKFGKGLYEHPLAPILDVAAIFTGGATLAGKGAAMAAKGSQATRAANYLAKAERQVGPLGANALANKWAAADTAAGTNLTLAERFSRYAQPTELFRYDVPGRSGRLKSMELDKRGKPRQQSAREPIGYFTSGNPATKYRQVFVHELAEKLALKGGKWGKLSQLPYEHAHQARLAGNMAAVQYLIGNFSKLQKEMDSAVVNPQKRAGINREVFEYNYDNVMYHSEAEGLLVPVEKWMDKSINRKAYALLTKRSEAFKKQDKYGGQAIYAGAPSDELVLRMQGFGKDIMTTRPERAAIKMVDGKPHVWLVNRHTVDNLGIEMANTANAAKRIYYKGTSMWKSVLLGLSPRFLVNNAVGNSFMHMVDNMGDHAVYGLYEGFKQTRGVDKANKWLYQALQEEGYLKRNHWTNRYYGSQLGQSLHHTVLPEKKERGRVAVDVEIMGEALVKHGPLEKAASKGFVAAGTYAERLVRRAGIISKVRSDPRIKAEMARLKKERPDLNTRQRLDAAADIVHSRDPSFARRISQEVEQTMGNYVNLSGPERSIRAVDPFYTWQRHIVKHATHIAMDRPGRAAFGTQLGHIGSDFASEGLGGEITDWMRSFVPGQEDEIIDRIPALNTSGLNPYASYGDVLESLISLMPGGEPGQIQVGESLGTMLNPFVQAGVEELTGASLLTGEPINRTEYGPVDKLMNFLGPVGRTAAAPAFKLPQATLLESIAYPPEYKSDTLYAKTPEEYFLALMGFPIKWVDPDRAKQLARQQQTRRGVKS